MSASQADVCEPLSLSIYDSQYGQLIHRGSSKAVRKKNFHRQSPAATLPFATGLGLVCGRDLADDFGLVLDVID